MGDAQPFIFFACFTKFFKCKKNIIDKVTQVFNSNRGREFEVSQGYIEIPCLKKKEKCTRLCRKIMLFASSCPEAYIHQMSRFIFLACSNQKPTTPLLMVQICLFLVPLTEFNQMLGLMACTRNFNVRASLAYEMSSQNQVQFKGFSGFSVSLKVR